MRQRFHACFPPPRAPLVVPPISPFADETSVQLLSTASAADVKRALESFTGVRKATVTATTSPCCSWHAEFPDQVTLPSTFTRSSTLWVPSPLAIPNVALVRCRRGWVQGVEGLQLRTVWQFSCAICCACLYMYVR